MIFKYDKKIDKECWKRIVKQKEMFGNKFPSAFDITKQDVEKAKNAIKFFQEAWKENEDDFKRGIKKIYGFPFPSDIVCYINTSPYSMDNYNKGYISVSMYRDTPKKAISSIIHEVSHFMFRKYFTEFCKNKVEDMKEIVTVINNIELKNIQDYGWKIHRKQRVEAEKIWKKTHSMEKVIEGIKDKFF